MRRTKPIDGVNDRGDKRGMHTMPKDHPWKVGPATFHKGTPNGFIPGKPRKAANV